MQVTFYVAISTNSFLLISTITKLYFLLVWTQFFPGDLKEAGAFRSHSTPGMFLQILQNYSIKEVGIS